MVPVEGSTVIERSGRKDRVLGSNSRDVWIEKFRLSIFS